MPCSQTFKDHTKKKTPQYRERDEEKRSTYLKEIDAFPEKQRVYLDESGLWSNPHQTLPLFSRFKPHRACLGKPQTPR
jgi:hypothetical protein